MQELFKHIVVLTDIEGKKQSLLGFSAELAHLCKAKLDLVHLLNHLNYAIGSPLDYHLAPVVYINNGKREIENKLKLIASRIGYENGLQISVKVLTEQPEKSLKQYAMETGVDLVILQACNNKLTMDYFRNSHVERIINYMECPVLTITGHKNANGIKSIVIPVGDLIPRRKLKLAFLVAKVYSAKIHLVTSAGVGEDSEKCINNLLSACAMLKAWGNVQVECKRLDGADYGQSVIRYARKIFADLIVVNPGRETRLSGWINFLLGARIYTDSGIPVLIVKHQN
ncbi:MAG: universal stress protein [Chitinophagaceae bacterium]|nr:universal stress protein [Chitinophagaceae bacterium]